MLDEQPAARVSARLSARKTFGFEFGAYDDDEHEAGLFNDVMSRLYSSTERDLAKRMLDCFLDKVHGVGPNVPSVPLSKNVAHWGEKIAKVVRRMSIQNKPMMEGDICMAVDAISHPKPASRPSDPREWTTDHVMDWMVNDLHLPEETASVARREEITGPVLLSITEDDLRNIGVGPFGRRRTLKLAIVALVESTSELENVKNLDIADMETVSISPVPKSVKSSTIDDMKASIVRVPNPEHSLSQRSNVSRFPSGYLSAQAPLPRTPSTCRSFSPQRRALSDIRHPFPRIHPPPLLNVADYFKPTIGPRASPAPNLAFLPAARAIGTAPVPPPNQAADVGARETAPVAQQVDPWSSRMDVFRGQIDHMADTFLLDMPVSSPLKADATAQRDNAVQPSASDNVRATRINRNSLPAAQYPERAPVASAWNNGGRAGQKDTSSRDPMAFRSMAPVTRMRSESGDGGTTQTSSARGFSQGVPFMCRAGPLPKVPSTPSVPELESFSRQLWTGLRVRPVTPLRVPNIGLTLNPATHVARQTVVSL
eukprot:GEMP01026165.1.p1 GENE.GEMP01026165.1~~GEMP01026165.1.p1  ORF type:complete len:540 (+),score=120.89 GEMP01026165.1:140-1759(+)